MKLDFAERRNGQWSAVSGTALLNNEKDMEVVDFNPLRSAFMNVEDTDYDNYMVLTSCFSLWAIHWEYAWLLVRNQTAETTDELIGKMVKAGVDLQDIHFTSQEGCPTYFGSFQ